MVIWLISLLTPRDVTIVEGGTSFLLSKTQLLEKVTMDRKRFFNIARQPIANDIIYIINYI